MLRAHIATAQCQTDVSVMSVLRQVAWPFWPGTISCTLLLNFSSELKTEAVWLASRATQPAAVTSAVLIHG